MMGKSKGKVSEMTQNFWTGCQPVNEGCLHVRPTRNMVATSIRSSEPRPGDHPLPGTRKRTKGGRRGRETGSDGDRPHCPFRPCIWRPGRGREPVAELGNSPSSEQAESNPHIVELGPIVGPRVQLRDGLEPNYIAPNPVTQRSAGWR